MPSEALNLPPPGPQETQAPLLRTKFGRQLVQLVPPGHDEQFGIQLSQDEVVELYQVAIGQLDSQEWFVLL